MSKLGFCSRSQAESIIRSGRVSVNGRTVTDLEFRVQLQHHVIRVRGAERRTERHRTIAFHKPAGAVTTTRDERGRRTVFELLGNEGKGLKPVGRLDMDTTGLLLFTSDHQLMDRLTDPRSGVPKEYIVETEFPLNDVDIRRLEQGIEIRLKDGPYRTRPVSAMEEAPRRYRLILQEGKNRQVRRMIEAIGGHVLHLQRIRFGPIALGELPEGAWRSLTPAESAALATAVRPGQGS